ncbi:MAG: SDR family oxidoreductase [Desulfocurvibacter africanus]
MSHYDILRQNLLRQPRSWLVTGVAGFIGSNILQALLQLDQHVLGVDNFLTGKRDNLVQVRQTVSPSQWARFNLVEGDVREQGLMRWLCTGVDHVLHQAALGSVPWSIDDPLATHEHNLTGFLMMLQAAKNARVRSFVYASSSAVYGNDPALPVCEDAGCMPLSPYAASKLGDEIYAHAFAKSYGFKAIGLRYFNIFGPRQDPSGAYAAVIPLWFSQLIRGEKVHINGDGETTRDFCYVEDCVQANILASVSERKEAQGEVYNIALGRSTSLNNLFSDIRSLVAARVSVAARMDPAYRNFRPGDVRHSVADTSKAQRLLSFAPEYSVSDGLAKAADWYMGHLAEPAVAA